jgi:signal transduction histidine kinase
MRALANETLDQMQLLAEEKRITLDCAAGEPVFALGDRDRLKQVTVNLLDNAIKYTPPGGHIGVDIESKDERVMLAIRDTGIGIAPNHHANVFERFFRVAPDRGPSGAGLGLAIVKSICLAHGGTVTVESRPEGGSVFRVTLPLASSGSPSRPSDSEATAAAPEKIPLSSSPG